VEHLNVAIYREVSPKDCIDEIRFADTRLRAEWIESEIDGQDVMILTLPRTRMRKLRFYKQIKRLYDKTGVLGARLKDIVNRWLELVFEVQAT